MEGYAAGASAWLAEHGAAGLPEWCRDAPWVGPVGAEDLYAVSLDLALMGSGRNLIEYVGSAQPPGAQPAAEVGPPPATPGSNGWALGRSATENGRGLVMANPHFPWHGEGRLWECHLRIPGALDVYGATLVGSPLVLIGLNRDVAWTHTFSRGHRFTIYQLSLVEGDPTRYRYGDEERAMVPVDHTVAVLGDDGDLHSHTRTMWSSHYGPMLNLPFVGWSDAMGFSFRDANLGNDRFLAQVLDFDRATSVDDMERSVHEHGGWPWVNTMAAGSDGRVFYIDSSATPHLSPEANAAFVADLAVNPIAQLFHSQRAALLDGSDPANEWIDAPGAPAPGLVPTDQLPRVHRDDHVFNANDPYWLAHPIESLAEHSPMHGLFRVPVSPRTRMNAMALAGEGPMAPSGHGGGVTPGDVEAALLGNRSLLAELVKDDVVVRCRAAGAVEVDGRSRDLSAACDVLDAWDGTYGLDARGAALWRELLGSFPEDHLRDAGSLFEDPFDPDHPISGPSRLAAAPVDGPDPLVVALAQGIAALDAAGVALDAPLGEVQWVDRGADRIPMPGANEVEGILNVAAPIGALARADLEPGPDLPPAVAGRDATGLREGGYPITYGVSFVMIAWFDDDGPRARGLTVYGQSSDPASVHHGDQAVTWSEGSLRDLALTDEAIDADPALERRTVRG
jgi:acyl-homoserine-lactone acylase